MLISRLDRLALNVRSLEQSIAFYCGALGFVAGERRFLSRGAQRLELRQCGAEAAAYPVVRRSNDQWFAHCALCSTDIAGDFARLRGFGFEAISRGGPQVLPGGIVAVKFRDPDGHPLELIQFVDGDPRTAGGIDHCAIAVADVARSVAFYAGMGLVETARQVNAGPAQEALDDLDGVRVDVVALMPRVSAPHLELLGYREPRGAVGEMAAGDVAAGCRVFVGDVAGVFRDPDGHFCEVEEVSGPF